MRPLTALPPLPFSHVPDGLQMVGRRYAQLPLTGLRVTARLGTPYIPSEPNGALHLDALIAWAVIQSLSYPITWPAGSAAVVPVPLELAWVSPEGLPLWTASLLRPDGDMLAGREYWHKRYPTDRADLGHRQNAQTRAGRWKEYRVPVATVLAREVTGLAIGHLGMVRDLLAHVTHLGKRAGTGYGRVLEWEVQPVMTPRAILRTAISAGRPVPVRAIAEKGADMSLPAQINRRGWTPPYWFVPWHEPCVESVKPDPPPANSWDIDWYEAVGDVR